MKNLLKALITLLGIAIGPTLLILIFSIVRALFGVYAIDLMTPGLTVVLFSITGIVFGIIVFLSSDSIIDSIEKGIKQIEDRLAKTPGKVIQAGGIGLIAGFVVAFLLSFIVNIITIAWITIPINIILYIICGAIGVRVAVKSISETAPKPKAKEKKGKETQKDWFAPKILDTSVIIDGRIFDICKTGFVEGTIVIPEFVLGELRHIADSADSLKRSKGRRGLDVLNKIQVELKIPVEVSYVDYEDMEVDAKLLKLAQQIDGVVVTNDFNLNKVAAVQGVPVLNINDLSNAVKPILIPGEELVVSILKEGKESNQGVAYLDDGTMIVVENARSRIGTVLTVIVTSVLQTSAGRMIFARIKDNHN